MDWIVAPDPNGRALRDVLPSMLAAMGIDRYTDTIGIPPCRNALVLLHQPTIWGLVDRWLCGLSDEHFMRIAPLVRRTFADFSAPERRDLGERARRPSGPAVRGPDAVPAWDAGRAALPLPLLRQILGLTA